MRSKRNWKAARKYTPGWTDGRNRWYSHSHREQGTAVTGHQATIAELEGEALIIQEVGQDQVIKADKEQQDFLTHLRNYGGEWFWEDIQTPDGTECLAEAIKTGHWHR